MLVKLNDKLMNGIGLLSKNYLPKNESLYWQYKGKDRVSQIASALETIYGNNDLDRLHPINNTISNLLILFRKVNDLHRGVRSEKATVKLDRTYVIATLIDLIGIKPGIIDSYLAWIIRYFEGEYHKTTHIFSGNLLEEIKKKQVFLITLHQFSNMMNGVYMANDVIRNLNSFQISVCIKHIRISVEGDLIWIEHTSGPYDRTRYSFFLSHPLAMFKIKKVADIKNRRNLAKLVRVEDVIRHAHPSLIFIVEFKQGVGDYRKVVDELVYLFSQYGCTNRLIINSYNLEILTWVKQHYPTIPTLMAVNSINEIGARHQPTINIRPSTYGRWIPYSSLQHIVDMIVFTARLKNVKALDKIMTWKIPIPFMPSIVNTQDKMFSIYKGNSAGFMLDQGHEQELYKFLRSITQ